jgi:hypothetical protein
MSAVQACRGVTMSTPNQACLVSISVLACPAKAIRNLDSNRHHVLYQFLHRHHHVLGQRLGRNHGICLGAFSQDLILDDRGDDRHCRRS